MNHSIIKRILYIILLLFIPLLYIITAFLFQSERGDYFLYSVDPEYSYLFNGLNVAQYTLKVWHVDHPGTPIQVLAAIVIRVVHLFHGNGSLLKDVMQNSALYTKAINVTMFSLNGLALFFLGYAAFKYTKSFIQSIFLQMTPFASYLVLTLAFRINPENMALFCFILMGFLVIKYLQDNWTKVTVIDKYLIGFAIVTGFSVAVKITFSPLFFIPFFLFKGIFRKIIYSLFSIVAFLIFIFPVLYYRFTYFHYWVKDLFLHSGQYGSGETNVFDKHEYLSALKLTFSTEYIFTISFFIFILACLIYQIPYIKIKIRNDKFYKVLIGITVSMATMILLVAKQYKFHYLTLALIQLSSGIWIVITIYFNNFKIIYKNLIFAILILLFLSIDFVHAKEFHAYNLMNKESQMKTVNFVNTNPSDKPLAISSKYYGCPYQEYALSFGLCWGGEIMRPHYVEVLKKIFPNTFIYNGWDKSFHDWEGNSFTVLDLLARYKAIRFYSGDIDVENNIFQSFKNNANNKTDIKINKIFSNEDTQENIYELFCSPKNNGGTLLK